MCECILIIKGYRELNWKTAKGMMSDPNFLRSLMEMDFDAITQSQVKNIRSEHRGLPKARDLLLGTVAWAAPAGASGIGLAWPRRLLEGWVQGLALTPPVSSGAWLLPMPIFAPNLAVPFSATCKLIGTKLRTASPAGKVLVVAEAQESGWAGPHHAPDGPRLTGRGQLRVPSRQWGLQRRWGLPATSTLTNTLFGRV